MPNFQSKSHIFDPRPDFPLLISVKRYWDPQTSSNDPDALTLVLAHATGYPKETWEPFIDDLFALVRKQSNVKIKDIWSIEAPNHAEMADVNEPVLDWSFRPVFRWDDWTRAIHLVLGGYGSGIDVDFRKRNLVAVGHSMGAVCLMLTTTHHPALPWSSFILIEPMFWPKSPQSDAIHEFLAGGSKKRRDVWPSLGEVRETFLTKKAWRAWDPRTFDLHLKYGFKPVDPNQPDGAVTLSTSKANEFACFNDPHGTSIGYRFLSTFIKKNHTHVIYGAIPDYIPGDLREDILKNVSGGIDRFASVSLVEKAGHLVTVTHPKQLADTVYQRLQETASPRSVVAVAKL